MLRRNYTRLFQGQHTSLDAYVRERLQNPPNMTKHALIGMLSELSDDALIFVEREDKTFATIVGLLVIRKDPIGDVPNGVILHH
jgi:hypothetical protein